MDNSEVVIGHLDTDARKKILIVAPHADDEAFGCGGMLVKEAQRGTAIHLVIFGMGGIHHRHLNRAASFTERVAELDTAARILGIQKYSVLYPGMDARLDTIPQLDMVTRLDNLLEQNRYDEVFYPYPSHNSDHQAVQKACVAALRPGAHPPINLIAMYEYTYSGWFPVLSPGGRLYVDITDAINAKRKAIAAYASQLKPPFNPVSMRAMEVIAAARGMECGCEYAELYHVIQIIKD